MASLREDRRLPGLAEAAALTVAFFLLDWALSRFGPSSLERGWNADALWLTGAVRAAEAGLILGYWRLRGGKFADFGLAGERAMPGVAKGLAAAALFGALVLGAEAVGRLAWGQSALALLRPASSLKTALFPSVLAAAVIAGPFLEELLFRGFVYGALRQRMPVTPALAAATLAFALPHGAGGSLPLVPAVGGFLFCLVYERTGSLWAPYAVHALGNLALFGLRFLPPGWFA